MGVAGTLMLVCDPWSENSNAYMEISYKLAFYCMHSKLALSFKLYYFDTAER